MHRRNTIRLLIFVIFVQHRTNGQYTLHSERGPSSDLETSINYMFGIMATMAMGAVSFAPDFMGYGAETTAEKGYFLRDTYLTSTLPLWLWASNFVTKSTGSQSALGDAAFFIGASGE